MKWARRIVPPALLLWLFVPASTALEVKKLANPQAFIVDSDTGLYYISSVAGRHMKKDNNGFITRLGPDGSVENLKFIAGGQRNTTLHAPKGMLIVGKLIYVADIDHVRVFDKESGVPLYDLDLAPLHAKYLSQLTVGPGGKIYVTETIGNAIFTIDPENGHETAAFVSGKEFDSVSGIVYSLKHNRFYITLAGGWIGELLPDGALKRLRQLPKKNLVGIDLDDEDNLYVSSFTGGRIYVVPSLGKDKPKEFVSRLQSPASISLDRKNRQILVPLFLSNRGVAIPF